MAMLVQGQTSQWWRSQEGGEEQLVWWWNLEIELVGIDKVLTLEEVESPKPPNPPRSWKTELEKVLGEHVRRRRQIIEGRGNKKP